MCRYCLEPDTLSPVCSVCQTTQSLWICLVCGNVGCGRYVNEHARLHYKETLHAYALELQTARVWDYAGDGYVHRLVQSNHDGKLVEVPSPHRLKIAPQLSTHSNNSNSSINVDSSSNSNSNSSSVHAYSNSNVNHEPVQRSLERDLSMESDQMERSESLENSTDYLHNVDFCFTSN